MPFAAPFVVSFAIACGSDAGSISDPLPGVDDDRTNTEVQGNEPGGAPDTSIKLPPPAKAEGAGGAPLGAEPADGGMPPNEDPQPNDDGLPGDGGEPGEPAGGGGTTGDGVPEPAAEAGAAPMIGGSAGMAGSGAGAGGNGSSAGVGGNGSTAGAGGKNTTGGGAGAGARNGGAGAPGAGGTPGASGGAAAGRSAGGSPAVPIPVPIPGETCNACGSDECSAQFTRCDASPVCSDWLDCVSACSDDDCARACDKSYSNAVLLTVPVYQCLCSSCASECSALAVCGQSCKEGAAPPAATSTAPGTLKETGLYASNGRIASYVRRYRPEYELFSDFAAKERYIYLPRCAQIDTRNMDHWSLPVGTRLWKQFTRDGVRIETRVLMRYGRAVGDWVMASYQWPSDGVLDPALATRAPDGGLWDVNGTDADIPSQQQCRFCHADLTERALGFGAIQLSHNLGGVTFTNLVDWGVLSRAPVRTGYDPPGDARARAALGYLHANCGGCHNDTGVHVTMFLRLLVNQTTVQSTWAYTTSVNVRTESPSFPMDRIEPGDPGQSAIIARLLRDPSAGERQQMPPFGRELVHSDGVDAVSAWIESLAR